MVPDFRDQNSLRLIRNPLTTSRNLYLHQSPSKRSHRLTARRCIRLCQVSAQFSPSQPNPMTGLTLTRNSPNTRHPPPLRHKPKSQPPNLPLNPPNSNNNPPRNLSHLHPPPPFIPLRPHRTNPPPPPRHHNPHNP